MKKNKTITRTEELKDELERVEYKFRCEMDFARKTIQPLKKQQSELLREIQRLENRL